MGIDLFVMEAHFMKKLFSSALSLLTAASFIASGNISAVSADEEALSQELCYIDEFDCSGTPGGLVSIKDPVTVRSNFNSDAFNYGQFLDENNFAVYSALFKNLTAPTSDPIIVTLPEPFTFETSVNVSMKEIPDDEKDAYFTPLFASCTDGICVFTLDVPEASWLGPGNVAFGMYNPSIKSSSRTRKYTVTVSKIQIQAGYLDGFTSLSDAAS